ncbi:ABC transporter ATP-binding protein [Paenibacillus barengoltzii]|uniref:ABC transporter ATP-binding protein n=1 Tax=Paenibacillus barengoltzii TaxID=343517 RepID=UPI003F8A4BA6
MFQLRGVKAKGILHVEELAIPEKAVTCIVGESGSGKSTLLRLLNQMDSCDEGEIFFQHCPLDEMNVIELRRQVIMVPQTPVMFGGTIQDNMQIGLSFASKPLATGQQLMQALHVACLDKDLSQDVDRLSGGEKQRLAIARALLINPMALLLDEPTSALDEDTANVVIQRIVGFIRDNGKTLVMITHSRSIANKYSDVIIEMKHGVPHVKEGLKGEQHD